MSKPFLISIHRAYTAEDVEVFSTPVTVRFNIMEAEIKDHGPDDEIEILDYTLEDVEHFNENHYMGTGDPDDGFIPFYSEQLAIIIIQTVKLDANDDAIRQIIIDEYHTQREV